MTVKQLIDKLCEQPPKLGVLAYSSNPEKWGHIEDLGGFELFRARYGYELNGVLFPPDGGDGAAFVVISTAMRRGLSVTKAVEALQAFDPTLPVVFDPYGTSAAHQFVEVAELRTEKFGVIKRSFRDIQDGRDFVDDVYVEDSKHGALMLLLWGL